MCWRQHLCWGIDATSWIDAHVVEASATYDLPLVGTVGCAAATPNSTGQVGVLEAFGRPAAAAGESLLIRQARGLPSQVFVLPVVSRTPIAPVPLAGGVGRLCIGGPNDAGLVRWNDAIDMTFPIGIAR